MLSFSATIIRNSHLHNNALNYKFKEKNSYQRFSVFVNTLTKRPIIHQRNLFRKVTLINNESKVLQNIHISSSLNRSSLFDENGKLSQLLGNQQPNASTQDLFTQLNFSKNNDHIERDDDNTAQSIPADQSTNFHERRDEKRRKHIGKDIEKMYPNPTAKLNEIYHHVNSELQTTALHTEFIGMKLENGNNQWKCTIRVSWPTEFSFSVLANTKMNARKQASIKCLRWLEDERKIHHGKPLLYSKAEIRKLWKIPTRISIQPETLLEAKAIADKYMENLKPLVNDSLNKIENDMFNFQNLQKNVLTDPVGRSTPESRSSEQRKERNLSLQLRYESRMMTDGYSNLPIKKYREKILDELANNQVILIKGDTGCGKTTQVPQYILDEFTKNGAATDCNIIVAQPRRISAISLAERVAEERREKLGDAIGYQIRLDQILPSTPGGILYCTAGVLLRKLLFNRTLQNCSHVIIDEAHERNINIDMILTLLKRAVAQNPSLKVLVMSATLNAELFEKYFNCKVIEVPGKVFPVKMFYMDHIDRFGLRPPSPYDATFEDPLQAPDVPSVDIRKMGELVAWIVKNKPPGGILCFLPGWAEIAALKKYLEEFSLLLQDEISIIVVHSRISPYEQKKIFMKLPRNKRKIVLATNIAETGITVSDIVYVVDSCIHKEKNWIAERGVLTVQNCWVSLANIHQRKGRAGRVKPGESFHMISQEQYDQLKHYPIPEVQRISLEKTVLEIKTYSDDSVMDFIQSMPEPPPHHAVQQALHNLIKLGAIDSNDNLTALGKRLAMFSGDPKLSKAMIYSTIFQCVSPMLTIAAIGSANHDLFTQAMFDREGIRRVKKKYHPSSDHIGMAWLFKEWHTCFSKGNDLVKTFCRRNKIFNERMYTVSRVREHEAEYLSIVRMLTDKQMFDDVDSEINEYSQLDELVKGVLLSGLNNIVTRKNHQIRNGVLVKKNFTLVMEDNSIAIINPESVNFKRKNWPSPFILFHHQTHLSDRRAVLIPDSTIISPLTTFLFCQNRIVGCFEETESKDQNDNNNNNEKSIIFKLQDNDNIHFICDEQTAMVLANFREAMWGMVRYMISTVGLKVVEAVDLFEQVNSYRIELLQVLAKMLSEAAAKIDVPEDEKTDTKMIGNKYKNY